MDRATFIGNFDSTSDAIEFENSVLSIGRDKLPAVAVKVLDQLDLTPTEEAQYYAFLVSQIA